MLLTSCIRYTFTVGNIIIDMFVHIKCSSFAQHQKQKYIIRFLKICFVIFFVHQFANIYIFIFSLLCILSFHSSHSLIQTEHAPPAHPPSLSLSSLPENCSTLLDIVPYSPIFVLSLIPSQLNARFISSSTPLLLFK